MAFTGLRKLQSPCTGMANGASTQPFPSTTEPTLVTSCCRYDCLPDGPVCDRHNLPTALTMTPGLAYSLYFEYTGGWLPYVAISQVSAAGRH